MWRSIPTLDYIFNWDILLTDFAINNYNGCFPSLSFEMFHHIMWIPLYAVTGLF